MGDDARIGMSGGSLMSGEFAVADVDRSIGERFAAMALRFGDRIAVGTDECEWSYAELAAKSDALAAQILTSESSHVSSPIAILMRHDAPLIAAMLGHALVATEDPKNFAEAKRILKVAVSRDNQDPFAWYQLGIIYDREGDDGRAALATAERSNLEDNPKLAYASAQMAMKGIPPNTPDWLRAQDISMVSKTELAKKDKRYRDEKNP